MSSEFFAVESVIHPIHQDQILSSVLAPNSLNGLLCVYKAIVYNFVFPIAYMTFLLSLSRYSIRNPTVSDICDTSPCQNGGSCQSFDLGRQYTCSCQGGWTGQDCQIAPDPCRSRPCRNNGECTVNTIGEVDCQCTTGYSGAFCEIGTLPTV